MDRAALDVAIELGVAYGGWVPQGGRAEDMTSPPGLLAVYPGLREHPSHEWPPRTKANVRDSAGTLLVLDGTRVGPGTLLTRRLAREMGRPWIEITVGEARARERMEKFLTGFDEDIALNVAGSRESSSPGIYEATRRLLLTMADLMVVGTK